jgi:hypothetical protein
MRKKLRRTIRQYSKIAAVAMTFIGSLLLSSVLVASSSPKMAKVSGALFDQTGARVPNATLIFQGKSQRWEVLTSATGTYEVELPAGIYNLQSHPKGFCHLERSRAYISGRAHLDIVLSTCGVSDDFVTSGALTGSEIGSTDPDWQFQSLQVEQGKPRLVIQYQSKKERAGKVVFVGGMRQELRPDKASVILSYDLWTLVASKLYLDPKAKTFCAEEVTIYSPDGPLKKQAAKGKVQNNELTIETEVGTCQSTASAVPVGLMH